MITPITPVKRINRLQLRDITFQSADDYLADDNTRERQRQLHLSILLSRQPGGLAKIVFNTTEGYREILGIVWGSTDKHLLLQGGTFIPVEAIAGVNLNY